jgi:hypothetical protein
MIGAQLTLAQALKAWVRASRLACAFVLYQQRINKLATWSCVDVNRCSCRADLNRRITFLGTRVGWCEFSAQLFELLCCRCSTLMPRSLFAAS